MKEVKKQVSP